MRNRGIERGCTAGRDHFCVLPSGKVTPCPQLGCEELWGKLAPYWEESPGLKKLRDSGDCAACPARQFLPAPSAM